MKVPTVVLYQFLFLTVVMAYKLEPGALVNVTFRSIVATRIPKHSVGQTPIPPYLTQLIEDGIKHPPHNYWHKKALMHARLMIHRQVYRRSYYNNNSESKGQLTFPPESVWKVSVDPEGKGPITMIRLILARRGTVKLADMALNLVNGSVVEQWTLPLDPEFLFQRNQLACVDTTKGPSTVVSAANAWSFYDDTKQDSVNLSCVKSIGIHSGSIKVDVNWTRLPYMDKVANEYRVGHPIAKKPRDLINAKTKNYRLSYKYFSNDSCLVGMCVQKSGWRRLLSFKVSAHNVGFKRSLNIARIGTNPNNTIFVENGVYKWNQCSKEFDHVSFLQAKYGNVKAEPNVACIHDSIRMSNNEFSPMATPYDTCEWQGISSGWSNVIQDGVDCNWIDVTDVGATKKHLKTTVNPRDFVCEGVNVYTRRPKHPIFKTSNGIGHHPACLQTPKILDNNVNTYKVPLRSFGSSVTLKCPVGVRPLSELRNCGWSVAKESLACTPGEVSMFSIKHASDTYFDSVQNTTVPNNPTIAVRVCESSWALGKKSVRCEFKDALAHGLVAPYQTTNITYVCPTARDEVEVGGLVSVLIAKYAAFEFLGFPVSNVTINAF